MPQFQNSDQIQSTLKKKCGQSFLGFYLKKISQGFLHFSLTRLHELYISAISHLITLKLKVTFHKIYALKWFFIYLKSHLSFYQLSDLTRSRDFRIVKRIFVSKRCLELKQLESLIARHFRKHKFLNSYLFFF